MWCPWHVTRSRDRPQTVRKCENTRTESHGAHHRFWSFLIAVVVPNTARGWERKNRPCRVRTKILEREGMVSWFETNPYWRPSLTTGRNQLSDSPNLQTVVFRAWQHWILFKRCYNKYLARKRVIDIFIRAARAEEKDLEIKICRIEWILRQYSRNNFDFHLPWMQTMSGWIPLRSISVHPPIRNAWAFRGSKPAATQIWLHLSSQLDLVTVRQRGASPWDICVGGFMMSQGCDRRRWIINIGDGDFSTLESGFWPRYIEVGVTDA